jgi:thiamine-phosphate pyrophosphorylase
MAPVQGICSCCRLDSMQLCAITDRTRSPQSLPRLAEGWSHGGVHFIQLREKDLDADALLSLAREIVAKIDRSRTQLLVNVSTPQSATLALAAGAGGVHLAGKPRAGAASRVRQAFRDAIISVPCHNLEDIYVASQEQVDLMLFSPVFEKEAASAQGLDALGQACVAAQGISVFALGGVTAASAQACVAVGAAGDEWRRL